MTNNEIDKLLGMLDEKTLEQVKKYLIKEREKNNKNLRQRTFESYMCNSGKKFAFNDAEGTYICEKSSSIIFTNGVSIYYMNKNLVNIDSTKIIKKSTNNLTQYHKRINELYDELLNKFEKKLKAFISELKNAQIDDTYINESLIKFLIADMHEYVENIFRKKEIEIANILLNNPTYKMDLHSPLLYGESNIGKVYILGLGSKK